MVKKLDEIGYQSSTSDPDVWMRPAVESDGEELFRQTHRHQWCHRLY